MTKEHEASRTLVKSPPELWAECSDAGSLARHLGEFGDIRITRLEPESAVAWEAGEASGTVRIEPSGWGTRVTLTLDVPVDPPEDPPDDPRESPTAGLPAEGDSENESPEEEADAKVEETLAQPDPALADDPARPRRRWRRLIERARGRHRVAPDPSHDDDPSPPIEEVTGEGAEVAGEAEEASSPVEESTQDPDPARHAEDHSPPVEGPDPDAVLAAALESLGQAHHRPFSRA